MKLYILFTIKLPTARLINNIIFKYTRSRREHKIRNYAFHNKYTHTKKSLVIDTCMHKHIFLITITVIFRGHKCLSRNAIFFNSAIDVYRPGQSKVLIHKMCILVGIKLASPLYLGNAPSN